MCCLFCLGSAIGEPETRTDNWLTDVRSYCLKQRFDILKEYFSLLSIANVSADKENIVANARYIKKMMEKRGIRVKIIPTSGNPVVYGEFGNRSAKQTLLFYVHYDGQPVDKTKWTDSLPFKPVLRPEKLNPSRKKPVPVPLTTNLPQLNDDWRIYARSASDDKAPLMALLAAMDALKASNVPIKNHVKFILDGEEEAGSPSLPLFCQQHKKLLEADVLFMCDGPAYYSGDPTLFFGVRGITTLDITIYGPNTNLHSGHFGNWAPNPAMRMAKLLASMKDKSGRVAVRGFYDTVVPLSEREKEALKQIPPYDDTLKKLYGFATEEVKNLSLVQAIQLPSLNIRGLSRGWVGDQARTILPSRAQASIDIRLVKGCDPQDMVDKVIRHVRGQGYHVIAEDPDAETRNTYSLLAKVVSERGFSASRTSMVLPVARRVVNALTGAFAKKTMVLPTLGGSLPIYIFEDTLKIPIIGVSIVNHDNNQHQADENLRLGNLWRGVETFAALLLMAGN